MTHFLGIRGPGEAKSYSILDGFHPEGFGSSQAVAGPAAPLSRPPALYFEIKPCFFPFTEGLPNSVSSESDTKEETSCIELFYIFLNPPYRGVMSVQ